MISDNTSTQSFSSVWTRFRIQLARYLTLLAKRWWLIALTISLGLCGAAWYVSQQPPAYLSTARMMVSGQIRINEGAQYTEELFNFFGTQVELMKSGEVRQRAQARVAALHPDLPVEQVTLDVGQVPKASIFVMRSTGKSGPYTQAFLDACMDEYIATKKEMRSQKSEITTEAIADELVQLEKEMQKGDEELHEFQKKNNIGFLHEEGNSAATYLTKVNRELADLRTEYNLLAMLNLDQALDREQVGRALTDGGAMKAEGALPAFSPIEGYQKAKQRVQELTTERANLLGSLRLKHPKITALSDEITRAEALVETFRKQSVESLKNRREAIDLQIKNLEKVATEWEAKALDLSGRIAEFDKLKLKSDRAKSEYDRLLSSMQSVDVTKHVNQDTISILEKASPSISIKPGLELILSAGVAAGALLGMAILFILDKLDDRIGSFMEFRMHFVENLLGQIPREPSLGSLSLISGNDSRHSLLESFRTLRSSILFLPVEGVRPKTFLVTSATPGEGKTTVASNMAISFAFSGAKTLLVDADLRRGRMHDIFGVGNEHAGFSKVLQQKISWQEAIVSTSTPNLSLIPRGKSLEHPGEHFLGKVTDRFLQEIYSQFEYIVIDSAPVMAADDTMSLAPKVDGTVFVLRFGVSSARATRKSLELLAQRQINVLGIVCNDVKLSESEYGYGYYYQYSSDKDEPKKVAAKVVAAR